MTNFRTGTTFPGTGGLTATGTDTYSARTDNVDVVTAEVVNSLANSVVKAQRLILDYQPMTTLGDLIIGGIAGVPTRLGIGSSGQVLTVSGGVPVWQTFSALTDPMTSIGDIIIRNLSNTTTRLPIGPDGTVLTADGGVPTWLPASSGFADPMTTIGDIIIRNGSNTTTRLGIGTAGQVLTVFGGIPSWQTFSALTDPMTTIGDMIYRDGTNTTFRLPIGLTGDVLTVVGGVPSWTPLPPTLTDPMTSPGDMIYRNVSNITDALPVGTEGDILTVSSGLPAWTPGFSDPMTTPGDLIYRNGSNTTDRLAISTDGNVLSTVAGAPAWAPPIPVGTVLPFAGTSAPTNYLLCYGQAVSRTTYSALFAVVSTIYGVGDGSTTFNLPDLRGRTVAGKDDMGGSAANRLTNAGSGITGTTLGAVGGAQNIVLTSAQLASHTHTMDHGHANTFGTNTTGSGHGHGHSLTSAIHSHSINDPGHGHTTAEFGTSGGIFFGASNPLPNNTTGGGSLYVAPNTTGITVCNSGPHTVSGTVGGSDGTHTHNITGSVTNFTGSTLGAGSDQAHANVQPTLVLNYIIRY